MTYGLREALIKRIQRIHEGTKNSGVPFVDGKARKLTHLKVWIDEGHEKREITTEQWRKDSRAGDVVDSLLDFAREHAFGYHQRGLAPRYFMRDYYGSNTHVHEWDLHIEPPPSEDAAILPNLALSDPRNGRNREGQVLDVMLHAFQSALASGDKKIELAVGVLERDRERSDVRYEKLADRHDKLSDQLEIALDRKLERDIRMANEQLKLQVKGAVAQQAVAALPAFAGLAHRALNSKLGAKEEKPLSEELDDFFCNLAELPADDVHPIIGKVFRTKDERDNAILMVQRYRGRKQIKQLDSSAVAAQDGVTRPMTFTRLGELAAANTAGASGGENAPQRPSPFR